MNNYIKNRAFTDYVHQNLAIPLFYDNLGWEELSADKMILNKVDMDCGIDYFFRKGGECYSVQERFRTKETQKYNDFTITYKRGFDINYQHHRAEHYKMNADYMLYGIVNSDIYDYKINCTDFIKLVLVDLKQLYIELYNETIQLSDSQITSKCKVVAGIRHKRDEDVSFITYPVIDLIEHFGNRIVVMQEGFIKENKPKRIDINNFF